MNLKKFTKAELISKINAIKFKQDNSNSSLIGKFIGILGSMKFFILKFTLIALLIKVFKKYSIFRRIFTIINTVLFAIFGFSMIDIYEIEFLSNFFHNIIEILSKFNENILELFGKKVEIPSKTESMRQINQKTTGIQTNNENSDRIIERFKKIINKTDEIPVQEEINIPDEKPTPFYENKYVIIGGMLVLACLAWYCYDDIKPIGSAILASIQNFKSKLVNSSAESDNQANNETNSKKEESTNNNTTSVVDPVDLVPKKDTFSKIKDWLSNKFNRNKKDEISPSVESVELINDINPGAKPLKDKLYDQFFKENGNEKEWLGNVPSKLNSLKDITGESNKFNTESFEVLNEIEYFTKIKDDVKFTDPRIKKIIYDTIKSRVHKLANSNQELYQAFVKNDTVQSKINNFINLDIEIHTDDILQEVIKSPASNTYNEIALATIEEQDHWSDKSKSPSILNDILSPLNVSKELSEKSSGSSPYKFSVINDDRRYLQDPSHPDYKELNLLEIKSRTDAEIENKQGYENPIVEHPEGRLDLEETKPGIIKRTIKKILDSKSEKVLDNREYAMEQIHSRRNDEDVLSNPIIPITENVILPSPNLSNIGLQNPIEKSLGVSPLIKKSSLSKIFENAKTLFDDNPIDTDIYIDTDNYSSSSKNIETKLDENDIKKAPSISNLLQQINSQRKEYGTPPGNSPLFENPIETIENPIDTGIDTSGESSSGETQILDSHKIDFKDIKLDIKRGDIQDRFVNIDFGENFDKISKVYIIKNDGSSQYFDPHSQKNKIQIIKWDNEGNNNPNYKDLDIFKIFIIQKNNTNSIEIYNNYQVKILDDFHKNRINRNK
jgi:hypothetical protein